MSSKQNKISKFIPRLDAKKKISGKIKYIDDIHFDDLLYAKTLRSTCVRAKITELKVPEIPEGYYIVHGDDAPVKNRVQMLLDDQPFFAYGGGRAEVNYIGEPILLVVGKNREIINNIIRDITVEYESVDAITTIEDARESKYAPIFNDDNVIAAYEFSKGDPEKAFSQSQGIYQETFETGYQEQMYLEPQGIVAYTEGEKVVIQGSMQCPYYVKNAMKLALGCDDTGVRIIQSTTGGAFGGKEDYPSLIAGHVAFATLKTGKPVKLVFDRNEDILATTKRHPSISDYKTTLDSDGNITALECEIVIDAGAYAGLSSVVLQRALFAAISVYNIENVRVKGYAYATNNVPSGAFRGFGAPQSLFAVETHLNNIAIQNGFDPVEFKTRHILKKGDLTATSGKIRKDIPLNDIIIETKKISDYDKVKKDIARNPLNKDGNVKGIGFSAVIHGCGFTGKGEEIIKGTARLKRHANGIVEILIANVEMGQGTTTTLRKIVAETLDISPENIIYNNPDTDFVPDSGPTVASRTIIIVGGLLESCAKELKEKMDQEGEIIVEKTYSHPAYIKWDQEKLKGDAYPEYSWGANIIQVSIDPDTFELQIEDVNVVYDVGVPIDEMIIKGQIDGGTAQGLGYATIEVMEQNNGHLKHKSITDYIVPTSMDFPKMKSRLVNSPYEYGPFGAKCAGELTLVGPAPAVASAVSNAMENLFTYKTGKRVHIPVNKIPITPEYLRILFEQKLEEVNNEN